ncbi:ATP12 family chaperone protein [Salinarimonas ramus]|uniref:ATPase n=1 Tax=Salinarimonas ramus TaxID=690164 RepID=A0A917QH99_9HYPH|nr:ATP12 family protein [Salinarimonas ramus]GGK50487.1 ATPase [Salinarimonas ramus]
MPDDFWHDLAPEPGETRRDPREAARGAMTPELPKRFYTCATAEPHPHGGFVLALDGRPAKTPGKRPLAAPTRAAGDALAAEWEGQGERIDPGTMPLTRILNSALDGVATAMEPVAAEIVKYAGSDLLCYRAGDPEALVAAQNAAWDPVLASTRERLGARFLLAEGVMYVEQPRETLEAIAARVSRETEPVALAALSVMTTITGSALIALAVADGALTADDAWHAAHVDELHQERVWGADAIALERRAGRRREFDAAVLLYGEAG